MTDTRPAASPPGHDRTATGGELKHGVMGAGSIAFLVIAAAAPLAAMVANVPLAIGLGDGKGVPGAFIVAGITLYLFSVGYAAMSRHITNAGAFFAYVSAGLGSRLGTAAGFVAIVSYNLLVVYLVGLLGYFGRSTVQAELHTTIPWEWFAFGSLALAGALAYYGIEIGTRVLTVLLAVEMSLLVAMDIGVLIKRGPGAFTPTSFSPHAVFSGAPGIGLTFAFLCFIGFEATAIFGEEAKDPRRTVPRATYIAIGTISVLYTVTSWAGVASVGGKTVKAFATGSNGASLFPDAAAAGLGGWAAHAMNWLVLSSLFATLIALHGMSSRYLFAFGREGLLPRGLGRTHPRYGSPGVAGAVQLAFTALVTLVYAVLHKDPYLDMAATLGSLATLGVVALQAAAAAAVVGFFRRRADRGIWSALIAPGLASLALVGVCILIVDNFSLITGKSSTLVGLMPWALLVVAAAGYLVGVVRPLRAPINVFADEQPPAPPVGPAHPILSSTS